MKYNGQGQSEYVEFGTIIYEVEIAGIVGYTYTLVWQGGSSSVFFGYTTDNVPTGAKIAAFVYTHQDGESHFSPTDYDFTRLPDNKLKDGVRLESGIALKHGPNTMKNRDTIVITNGLARTSKYENRYVRNQFYARMKKAGYKLPDEQSDHIVRARLDENRWLWLKHHGKSLNLPLKFMGDKLMDYSPMTYDKYREIKGVKNDKTINLYCNNLSINCILCFSWRYIDFTRCICKRNEDFFQ